MAQAIVDPDELRRFAQSLKRFTNELQQNGSSLNSQLNTLGSTWRDQEHTKFAEEFEQHLKVLARFTEASDQYIPYLLRKAQRIEEYLQQR